MTTDCTPVRPSKLWLLVLAAGILLILSSIFGICGWIISQRKCSVPSCAEGGRLKRIWVCGEHHMRVFFFDTSKHLDEEETDE